MPTNAGIFQIRSSEFHCEVQDMRDLRSSQLFCWRLISSGMWCCVFGWVEANILKPHLILQVYVNISLVDWIKYMISFASVAAETNIDQVILATLHIPHIYVSNVYK
jgi:hypothetical protein